jgi:hypothetical protein
VTAENRFFGFLGFIARAMLPACPISCNPPFHPPQPRELISTVSLLDGWSGHLSAGNMPIL